MKNFKKNDNAYNNFMTRKILLSIVVPIFLLVSAIVIIGSGCGGVPKDEFYIDADADGFGNSSAKPITFNETQGEEEAYVVNNNDCDDTNANIHPNAIDIPNNGIDEDCDGGDAIDGGTDN